MFCPNCDVAIDMSDNFCSHCGAPLTGAALPVQVRAAPLPAIRRNVTRVMIQGAVALALTAAAEMAARALLRRAIQLPAAWLRGGDGDKPMRGAVRQEFLPVETRTESQTVVVRRVTVKKP